LEPIAEDMSASLQGFFSADHTVSGRGKGGVPALCPVELDLAGEARTLLYLDPGDEESVLRVQFVQFLIRRGVG